jgi:hypothetical protein
MSTVSKLIFGAAVAAASIATPALAVHKGKPISAYQNRYVTPSQRSSGAHNCVATLSCPGLPSCDPCSGISYPGVNREVVVDSAELPFCALVFSPNKGGNVLEGPRRRERRNTTKHSAEKIYTNVKIIRFSAATDFCMTSSAPFAPRRVHFANARLKGGPAMPGRPYF